MRRALVAGAWLAALFGLSSAAAAPTGPPIPAPSGFVTDKAEIIDGEREAEIVALLDELERRTGAGIAVLTLQSTQPADDAAYARQVFDRWQVGQGRGILVLVAVRDRRVSIVPSRGIRRVLPGDRIDAIIDQRFVPAFKQGHYGRGILEGVWSLAELIAIDARVTLRNAPSLGRVGDPKKARMQAFGKIIAGLVGLLIAGLLWAVWTDYRKQGAIRDRGGPDASGSPGGFGRGRGGGFGGGARG
ncbi:MAG: TPM domain-containing protein [Myxococcota bacterium]